MLRKTIMIWLFPVILLCWQTLQAAQVKVRTPAGSAHYSLTLYSQQGTLLARGEVIRTILGKDVEKRMVIHFNDGSLYDEKVSFSQQGFYIMQHYNLVRSGPTFPDGYNIQIDRASGKYSLDITPHKGGQKKSLGGKLNWPDDLYEGMIPEIVTDLAKGQSETIHYAVFTPSPKLIKLEILPQDSEKVQIGGKEEETIKYELKAKLGGVTRFLAKVAGRKVPPFHAWVANGSAPLLVRFEGELYYNGPVWRLDLETEKSAR